MAVDEATVRRIAGLARISVTNEEVETLKGELSAILDWVELLNEVDVEGVDPMTSAVRTRMKQRDDTVDDGGYPDDVVRNAPAREDRFFVVPRVVESG